MITLRARLTIYGLLSILIFALTACGGRSVPLSPGTETQQSASRASSPVFENENETRYHPDLDIAKLGLNPQIVHPRELAVTDAALNSGFTHSKPAYGAFSGKSIFEESGQIDISGSTDGTYVTTLTGDGYIDVWTLGGTLVKHTFLNTFYCSTNQLSACSTNPLIADPRILFDVHGGRWIISAFPIAKTYHTPVFIAVSKTSDPRGPYYLYQISGCGPKFVGDTDQPRVGFSARWLVLSVPCYTGYPNLTVMNKSTLYAGKTLTLNHTYWRFTDPINVNGGNRDQPVPTYASSTNTEYLIASGITNGFASPIFSRVDGPVTAPVFHPGFAQVNTTFAVDSTVGIDAPGCSGCMTTYVNGWIHSSGAWSLKNGQTELVSTVVLGDPRYARSTQAIQVGLNTVTNAAVAMQAAGGADGTGQLGSEIAMPLTFGTSFNAAVLVDSHSASNFYPGLRAVEWNMDNNSIVSVNTLAEGTLTPTGFDQQRWLDFMISIAPIPGTAKLVEGGPVASTYSGDTDTQKLVLWDVITP